MSLRKALATAICICFCVFIFGSSIYLCNLLLEDEIVYFQRGASIDGVVLQKSGKRGTRPNSGSSWHVDYQFELDGVTHQNENMLDMGREYDSISAGDVISIVYDPQHPYVNRAELAAPWIRYSMLSFFIFAMSGVLAFAPARYLLTGKPIRESSTQAVSARSG